MKKTAILVIILMCFIITGCSHGYGRIVEKKDNPNMIEASAEPSQTEEQTAEVFQDDQPGKVETDEPQDVDLAEETLEANEYKQLITEYHKRLYNVEDVAPLGVYQSVPFAEGELVMAEFMYDGETSPELYYIVDNVILYSTVYSYTWSINYTVFDGHTILFGSGISLYSSDVGFDQDDLTDTYTIYSGFENETVSIQCGENGFILVKEGVARPLTYRVDNNKGKTLGIIDIPKETQFSLFDRGKDVILNYCPMTTQEAYQSTCSMEIAGETVILYLGQMHEDPELPMSYLWMDNWVFVIQKFAPGIPFVVRGGQNVYEFFWVDLSNATADSTLDELMMQTGRETPDRAGRYMLVFNADFGYYVKAVEIIE